LRGYNTPWTDSSSKVRVAVSVRGKIPSSTVCGSFCGGLAEITIVAKRANFNDSVEVTTYLYAKNP
jgi:hypothetical protein